MEPIIERHGHSPRLFRDRYDAGRQLAAALDAYRGQAALVLGIPRGGVPVAAMVAAWLETDLDIIVARKLGAPGHRELAIGAVTANGGRFLNQDSIEESRIDLDYLAAVTAAETAEARRREATMRGSLPAHPVEGRLVIIVDDGLATGATMRAAVRSVRHRQPSQLVVAVPVGSEEACAALVADGVDKVVCLVRPELFLAVGAYYEDFEPTEDAEVALLLYHAAHHRYQHSTA